MALPNNKTAAGDINGIEYLEEEGSGTLSIGWEEASASRVFYVDWADRTLFTTALLGNNIQGSSNQIIGIPATFPGYDFLVCQACQVEGLGSISNSGGTFSYEFARVTARYRKRDIQSGGFGGTGTPVDDVLATEEIDGGYETIDINGLGLFFLTSEEEISDRMKGAKRFSVLRHTLTEERTLNNRKAAVQACAGKVNKVAFLDVDPGKMLYEGTQMRRVITADGEQPYRLVHTFLERTEGKWNQVWDDLLQAWDDVVDAQFNPVIFYEEIDYVQEGLLGANA